MTGIKEKIGKNKYIWLICTLLLFAAVFLFYGHYKEYLYEDEVLSFTAANSPDGMRPSLPLNRFAKGRDFVLRAVTVQKENRFSFGNAIKNTSSDPHPPLYLLLLHFISSLTPEVFSKWQALLINLLFGMGAVALCYFTSRMLYGKEKEGGTIFAGTVTAAFILSLSFMHQCMNLRMYIMLLFFTMALTLQYLRLFERGVFGKRALILLLITAFLGTETHYYFLIFAFYEAAFYTICLLIKKRIKDALFHALSYLGAFLLVFITFPSVIWQLTMSDVGSGSFAERDFGELIRRIRVMLSLVNRDIFGGEMLIFALFFICCGIFFFVTYSMGKEHRRLETPAACGGAQITDQRSVISKADIKAIFLLFTIGTYFLTVSFTTPYLTERYLTPVFPLIIMVTAYFSLPFIGKVFKNEAAGLLILLFILALPLIKEVRGGLYDVNKAVMQELSKEHGKDPLVFFKGISKEENYFEIMNYDRVMNMRLKPEENEDPGETEELKTEDEIVVYVPEGKDPEDYFSRIREINPDLTEAERLYKAYYSDAYILRRKV